MDLFLFNMPPASSDHPFGSEGQIARISFLLQNWNQSILDFDLTRCLTYLRFDGGRLTTAALLEFPSHTTRVTATAILVGSTSNPWDLKHISSVLKFPRAEFEAGRLSPVDVDQVRALKRRVRCTLLPWNFSKGFYILGKDSIINWCLSISYLLLSVETHLVQCFLIQRLALLYLHNILCLKTLSAIWQFQVHRSTSTVSIILVSKYWCHVWNIRSW